MTFFTSITLILALLVQAPPAQNASLRIVVVEGEDAVNIIQQKTAVAPIIEVRDRNNLPVAGATVTFAVGGNAGAFAGGASTLTVVTNSAGQAVAAGISPLTSGAMQINVTAAFQGQTAIATVTQTNFMTAAQAAGAASSAAGGSSGTGSAGATGGAGGGSSGAAGAAGGAAGGAGGGLSGLAIGGIVGGAAAVAGGVLVATGGGDDSSTGSTGTTGTSTSGGGTTTAPTTPTTPQPTTVTYNGPISGTFASTGTVDSFSCTFTYNTTGTMRIVLETRSDGSVGGTASGTMSFREASAACSVPLVGIDPDGSENGSIPFSGTITGTTSSFRFSQTETQSIPVSGGSVNTSFETSFTGSVSGGVINGQLTLASSSTFNIPGLNARGTGTGSSTVTLRP